ncbi:MAG: hypothetical protein RL020_1994 [Pseudomonadota bacterium]|jgi:hypothetical protein
MKLTQLIFTASSAVIFFAATTANAASPLGVDFHTAYASTPAVQQARAAGKITSEIAAFLAAPNPIAEKAAVINVLNNKGKQQNAKIFRDYLAKNSGGTFNADSLGPEQQFALGYLTALDDPAQSQKALPMLEKAKAQMPDSFTIAMILNLVKAQQQIGKHACKAWTLTEDVLSDDNLSMDMREEAVDIIEESMGVHAKDNCK